MFALKPSPSYKISVSFRLSLLFFSVLVVSYSPKRVKDGRMAMLLHLLHLQDSLDPFEKQMFQVFRYKTLEKKVFGLKHYLLTTF